MKHKIHNGQEVMEFKNMTYFSVTRAYLSYLRKTSSSSTVIRAFTNLGYIRIYKCMHHIIFMQARTHVRDIKVQTSWKQ